MTSKPFIDITPTEDLHRWRLPLTPQISVGPAGDLFMFGGAGLAAAVRALELSLGLLLVWATAQFLSFARPPSVVELQVEIAARGRQTSLRLETWIVALVKTALPATMTPPT